MKYIVTQPILDLWEEAVWRLGTLASKLWREKERLDLAGMRVATEAAIEE